MEPISDFKGHSTVLSLSKKCQKAEVDLPLQEREDRESHPGYPCSYPASVNREWFNG
jgi:hypothetical protein